MKILPGRLMKLWTEWQLRVMILLSLFLQIVLFISGKWRRCTTRNWVRILVWMTYLIADWAATVSLGVISSNQQEDSADTSLNQQNVITAFWAPFLLLHLGGPDTITAYSLEDNELWLRHLLGLGVQVVVAFYVFLKSWTGTNLAFSYLSIPVFIAGIIKYGERTWALRSASSNYFRDSLLPVPDPGPDYAKVMEKYSSIIARGGQVRYSSVIEPPRRVSVGYGIQSEAIYLHEAHFLFKMLRQLYAGLILSFHEEGDSWQIIANKSPSQDAFKLIEVELGFMYDMLYTKAAVVYSRMGTSLRTISFLSSISALLAFSVFTDKQAYSSIDIGITYLLLVGAVVLEIYAVILVVFSDWAMLWLTGLKNPWANSFYRAVFISRSVIVKDKRWSRSMAQYNLIGFCLEHKATKCDGLLKFFGIYETIEKHWYKTYEDVHIDVKKLIFQQVQEKRSRLVHSEQIKQICAERGYVLGRHICVDKFGWSLPAVEFDHGLLLWHIATDLCYYSDLNKKNQVDSDISSNCKISKSLSDYMLYLLVMRPFMLPKGVGEIRFRDTCAELVNFYQDRKNRLISHSHSSKIEACMLLLGINTEGIEPRDVKGDRSKSVLFDGCKLAKSLQSLVTDEHWDVDKKWEMISHVWVEMLCFAASQCGWKEHVQQLRRGGELLTHVCLLMANIGLCEQFQISSGQARFSIDSGTSTPEPEEML